MEGWKANVREKVTNLSHDRLYADLVAGASEHLRRLWALAIRSISEVEVWWWLE